MGKQSQLNSGLQHSKQPTNTSQNQRNPSISNKSLQGAESLAKNLDGTVSVGILPNVQHARNQNTQNHFASKSSFGIDVKTLSENNYGLKEISYGVKLRNKNDSLALAGKIGSNS